MVLGFSSGCSMWAGGGGDGGNQMGWVRMSGSGVWGSGGRRVS